MKDEITNNEVDRCLAIQLMRWEELHVDYFDTPEAPPRQVELEEWMTTVQLENIGDYYIDVKKNFWIHKDDWQPTRRISQALGDDGPGTVVGAMVKDDKFVLNLHITKDKTFCSFSRPFSSFRQLVEYLCKPAEATSRAAVAALMV